MITIVLIVGGAILLWIGVAMVFSAGERAKASEGVEAAGPPEPQSTPESPGRVGINSPAWQEKFIAGLVMVVMSLLQWVSVVMVNR